MSRKFLRVDSLRISRLGRNRPKLRKWRRPRGKSNKLRLRRAGYPSSPTVGHRTPNKFAGKISGLVPVLVHNLKELESAGKNNIVIIARVGARNKMGIIKKAGEMNLKILNLGGKK